MIVAIYGDRRRALRARGVFAADVHRLFVRPATMDGKPAWAIVDSDDAKIDELEIDFDNGRAPGHRLRVTRGPS